MAEKILEMYACPECDQVHEDSYDASSCCEPEIDKVLVCAACFEHDEESARGFY